MGILDVAAPLLRLIDSVLGFLPAVPRVALWGAISAAACVGVYRLVARRAQSGQIRRAAAVFCAVLPVIAILVFVNKYYTYSFPQAGGFTHGHTMPEQIPLADLTTVAGNPEMVFLINYPDKGATSEVVAANGEKLADLPLTAPLPMIYKKQWWNLFIGNPNGYLPDDYEIDALHLTLPKPTYLLTGPEWMRGWQFLYFSALVISLALILAAPALRARQASAAD